MLASLTITIQSVTTCPMAVFMVIVYGDGDGDGLPVFIVYSGIMMNDDHMASIDTKVSLK